MEQSKARPIRLFLAGSGFSGVQAVMDAVQDSAVFEVVGSAGDGETCLEALAQTNCDILVAEFDLPKISGVKVAEYLSLERPEIATVILAEQTNLGYLRSAMLAGAREFLIMPMTGPELAFALRRVFELEGERQTRWRALAKPTGVSAESRAKGKVVTVCSAKGGTGKSFIAANLAERLSSLEQLECAAVDLDWQFGDLDSVFNIKPKKTVVDLLPVLDELDAGTLRAVATKPRPYLSTIHSPGWLGEETLIGPEQLMQLLAGLRQVYDVVVVNTGSGSSALLFHLLDASELVLIVTNPQVVAIRNCQRLKSQAEAAGVSLGAFRVVINKSKAGTPLTARRAAETLQLVVAGIIPSVEEQVDTLLNAGRLVADAGPGELLEAFDSLAQHVANELGLLVGATG